MDGYNIAQPIPAKKPEGMAVSIMSSSRVWRQKHDRNCERIKENMYLSKKTVLKNKLYYLLYTLLFTYSQNTYNNLLRVWYFLQKGKTT